MEEKKYIINKKLFQEIEKISKNKFIKFVKDIYGYNEVIFKHIINIPVMSNEKIYKEKIFDGKENFIDECITEKMNKSEIGYIKFHEFEAKMTLEEIEEWQKLLNINNYEEEYDAIIIYNNKKIQKKYEEFKQKNKEEQDILNSAFASEIEKKIIYQLCDINFNYYEEQNNLKIEYKNINDSLLEILAQMINNHKKQNEIIDCIYEIAYGSQKDSYKYKNNNYLNSLAIFTLFSEQLTKWMLFGAYEENYENKLRNFIAKIVGENCNIEEVDFKSKIQNYIKDKKISSKQKEILSILGFIKKENNNCIREEKDVNTDMIKVNKIGFIKKVLNKIKQFLKMEKNESKNY